MPDTSVPVLRARALVKVHGSGRGKRRVVDGVELDVLRGECVAIVGRSGSGKSTLLHLLGLLDRPDAGTIELAGQRAEGLGDRALTRLRLRHVGFVFQSFELVEELSGERNVLLPTTLPGAPPGGPQRARRLLEELGVAAVADHRPHELSGGEQQRFALARALVNDPGVVLADEPTGNLDRAAADDALALLRGLADAGRAVVIVTHDPAVATLADRRLEMRDGRLVESGARVSALDRG